MQTITQAHLIAIFGAAFLNYRDDQRLIYLAATGFLTIGHGDPAITASISHVSRGQLVMFLQPLAVTSCITQTEDSCMVLWLNLKPIQHISLLEKWISKTNANSVMACSIISTNVAMLGSLTMVVVHHV